MQIESRQSCMIIWIPFIVLCLANTDSRSFMNAAFRTKADVVDAEFIKQAEKHGIIEHKGASVPTEEYFP